ncbi:hypothetical protein BH20VER1_BH20VER1_21630 [soil metagenome]
MNHALRSFFWLHLAAAALLLAGCASHPQGIHSGHAHGGSASALSASIAAEPQGDYYIGRRYYKREFKFWGYVRRPGQPWSSAQLVMMNESQKLAPDRAREEFGFDNGYEYRLSGNFTGERVYEPASNGIYPEFMLRNYQLISSNPPPIFKSQRDSRARAAVGRLTVERPE